MAAVRSLFVDRNWNRKFPNMRYDFDLYGGIANRSARAKHARPDARVGLSLSSSLSLSLSLSPSLRRRNIS